MIAAANNESGESTPWGWIVFGIVGAGLLGFGLAWWLRGRRGRRAIA